MKPTKRDLYEKIELLENDMNFYVERYLLSSIQTSHLISSLEGTKHLIDKGLLKKEASVIIEEILSSCIKMRNRIFDESICNTNLKSMYFCDLPKDHEGLHEDQYFKWE